MITDAEKMYDKIYRMKFLPPGRGLWAMGTPITEEKGLYEALNNCAFVSTNGKNVQEFVQSFVFLMNSSMLGIGVGFDTRGADKFRIFHRNETQTKKFTIEDTREAWIESTKELMLSYLLPN